MGGEDGRGGGERRMEGVRVGTRRGAFKSAAELATQSAILNVPLSLRYSVFGPPVQGTATIIPDYWRYELQ